MIRSLFILIPFAFFRIAIAQSEHAASLAIGGCQGMISGNAGLYDNPAMLFGEDGWNTVSGYHANSFIQALSYKSAGAMFVHRQYAGGILLEQSGDKRLARNRIDLLYAQQFGERIAAGVRLSYRHRQFARDYGSESILTGSLGMRIDVSETDRISFALDQPDRQVIYRPYGERLASRLSLGWMHRFSRKFSGTMETEKWSTGSLNLKSGVQYQLHEKFAARLGFQTLYRAYSFGFGFPVKKFRIDLACIHKQQTGFSAALNLGYSP